MGWLSDLFSDEKEKPKVEKYDINIFCMNCKNKSEVEIIKGNFVKESLRKIKCSNCGLNQFVPYSLSLHLQEGIAPIQIESLIDWINVDDEFKNKYTTTKK